MNPSWAAKASRPPRRVVLARVEGVARRVESDSPRRARAAAPSAAPTEHPPLSPLSLVAAVGCKALDDGRDSVDGASVPVLSSRYRVDIEPLRLPGLLVTPTALIRVESGLASAGEWIRYTTESVDIAYAGGTRSETHPKYEI